MNAFVCFLYMRGKVTLAGRDNSTSLLGLPFLKGQLFVCLGHVKTREGITLLGRISGFKLLQKARKVMILFTCHNGFVCNSMYKN